MPKMTQSARPLWSGRFFFFILFVRLFFRTFGTLYTFQFRTNYYG